MLTRTLSILFVAAIAMIIALPAAAEPVSVVYDDATDCDPLESGTNIHELGLGLLPGSTTTLFPSNEEIFASAQTTNLIACPGSDDDTLANVEIRMQNLSGIDWRKVWYVADLDTNLSNADGTVNSGHAFLINSVGLNQPLVFESLTADGIFEAGEFWTFIIDDYSNAAGISAAAFYSVGLVGNPSTGDAFKSTGSIIATAVPEPASLMLVLLGAGAMVSIRRRRS